MMAEDDNPLDQVEDDSSWFGTGAPEGEEEEEEEEEAEGAEKVADDEEAAVEGTTTPTEFEATTDHGHGHGHEGDVVETPPLTLPQAAQLSNGHGSHEVEEGEVDESPYTATTLEEQEGGQGLQRVEELEWELQRTREDRQAFEDKYNALLSKLTIMRNTVKVKLEEDANELDRREQEINDLRATTDDFTSTIETLKTELIQAHEDSERLHSELENLRARAFNSQKGLSDEAAERELALRDAQEEVERIRIDRDEWEGEAMRERVQREELTTRLGQLEMELGQCKADRDGLREERDREAESATNLHAVLEEFQAAKEKELRSTLGDLQSQLDGAHDSIGIWKQRALAAEANFASAQNDSERVIALSKELKEKTLLTGKLRHEAVILNEHLTEALRRLKKDSSENSVDRRLVSNVLISFLNTPRGDTKKFEMLQLLSSILSWSDDQREQVGLQRSVLSASTSSRTGRGHARTSGTTSGKGKAVASTQDEEDGLGENESFSNLFIEFLLKEANQAAPTKVPTSPTKGRDSGITSPTGFTSPTSPTSPGISPPLSAGGQQRFILPELGSPPQNNRRPSFTSFFNRGSRNDPEPAAARVNGALPSSSSTSSVAILEES